MSPSWCLDELLCDHFSLSLVQDADQDLGVESLQRLGNVLDISNANVADIGHHVGNVTLAVTDLLADVVVAKDLVDAAQDTRNVLVNVDDSGVASLVLGQGTQVALGQVDTTQSDTLVDVAD